MSIFDEDEMKKSADRAERAMNGRFKQTYSELNDLSSDDIARISPDITAMEKYKQLIEVVEVATEQNIAQHELIDRIRGLGDIAVNIAKKLPSIRSRLK